MKSNRYKVLVVEDEPNINEFVSTLLDAGGYQVVQALSGSSAMLLFNSHRPDLIILDLGLPERIVMACTMNRNYWRQL